MNNPLVSVIIPNYNYANFVGEAIESALSQSYGNIEIIVVDDGSTDDSIKILSGFGEQIVVIAQENSGVSAARNNGVRNSSGQLVAFLDADDIWLPEKVEKQVELFKTQNQLGLVHVGVEEFNEDGNVIETRLDGQSGWVSREFLLFERPVVLGGGSGLMITRSAFDEVEGFDLNLLTSADWDIFYRISRRYQIGFVPEVLLRYRIHGSNMHGNIGRMEREMMYGFDKAFTETTHEIQSLKNKAYGNLHRVLSGSYFRDGQYKDFARHAFISIRLNPSNISYFIGVPFRRIKSILTA